MNKEYFQVAIILTIINMLIMLSILITQEEQNKDLYAIRQQVSSFRYK